MSTDSWKFREKPIYRMSKGMKITTVNDFKKIIKTDAASMWKLDYQTAFRGRHDGNWLICLQAPTSRMSFLLTCTLRSGMSWLRHPSGSPECSGFHSLTWSSSDYAGIWGLNQWIVCLAAFRYVKINFEMEQKISIKIRLMSPTHTSRIALSTIFV